MNKNFEDRCKKFTNSLLKLTSNKRSDMKIIPPENKWRIKFNGFDYLIEAHCEECAIAEALFRTGIVNRKDQISANEVTKPK